MYAAIRPSKKEVRDITMPSQNFNSRMSAVSQPIAFSMPISCFSSALMPVALSYASIQKAMRAEEKIVSIMPLLQLKTAS